MSLEYNSYSLHTIMTNVKAKRKILTKEKITFIIIDIKVFINIIKISKFKMHKKHLIHSIVLKNQFVNNTGGQEN